MSTVHSNEQFLLGGIFSFDSKALTTMVESKKLVAAPEVNLDELENYGICVGCNADQPVKINHVYREGKISILCDKCVTHLSEDLLSAETHSSGMCEHCLNGMINPVRLFALFIDGASDLVPFEICEECFILKETLNLGVCAECKNIDSRVKGYVTTESGQQDHSLCQKCSGLLLTEMAK